MKPDRTEAEYLDQVTEGLREDAELYLDVRSELAAHLEDAKSRWLEQGHGEEEAARESVAGMGDALEAAASLRGANLARMKWRGLARIGLQYLLAPAAVGVAFLVTDYLSDGGLRGALSLGSDWESALHSGMEEPAVDGDGESVSDAHLILYGDPTQEGRDKQARTLWERHPTNTVYLGHYITKLLSTHPGGDEASEFIEVLEAARELEPANARFELVEAALLMQKSTTLEAIPDADVDSPLTHRLTILDPEGLAEGMETLEAGLSRSYLKRYSRDMLALQYEVLGNQRRFSDWLRRTAVAAAVLLPDLQYMRDLSRLAVSHGYGLLQQGKVEEARGVLYTWEPLVRLIGEDAFTLIEILVIGAILQEAETTVAAMYEEAGLAEDARRTRSRAGRIRQGIQRWQDERENETPEDRLGQQAMVERGSTMSRILMPALGVWPEAEAYDASRRLEYTMGTEVLVVVVSHLLVALLLGCSLVALRWWIGAQSAAAIPILLLPPAGRLAMVAAWGTLIPLGIFLVATRYLPTSGHSYSVAVGGHKLIAEFGLLAAAWMWVPVWLTVRRVRDRCAALDLPVAPLWATRLRWPAAGSVVGLGLVWLMPATDAPRVVVTAICLAGALGLVVGIAALASLMQGFWGSRAYGLYYGTLSRSLVPILALTIILIGLVGSPLLVRSEARYLSADSLMVDTRGGFTAVESQLVDRLLKDLRASFASLDPEP